MLCEVDLGMQDFLVGKGLSSEQVEDHGELSGYMRILSSMICHVIVV